MKKKILTIPLLSTALFLTLTAAQFSPWDAWREAYNSFERGEQLRAKGEYVQALEEFRAARGHYLKVKEARPDWNQKIIEARLTDCDQAIAAVGKLLGENEVTRTTSAAVSGASEPSSSVDAGEVAFLKKELEKYKEKLLESMVEVEELRRRLTQSEAAAEEVTNLLRDQRVMQEKYALLEKRYQALERQALEPDTRNAELRNQLIEEKLNSEVVARRLQLAQSRIQKLEEEANVRTERQRTAEMHSSEMSETLRRRERELAELQKLRDAEALRLSGLQQQLETAQAGMAEAVRLRNETASAMATLQKQLEEALASGGSSASLNAKLNDENNQLRETLAEAETRAAEARDQISALQARQRELQLELVQVRETLQRFDETRKRLETENRDLQTALERERAAAELNSGELKNLRERNQQLESDMQDWAARCEKLEKRLENRNQEDFKALTAADAERQQLREELNKLRDETAGLRVQLEQAVKARAEAEGRESVLNAEQLRLKTAAASAEAKLLEAQQRLAELEKLAPESAAIRRELAELRTNFQALQREDAENRKVLAEYKKQSEQMAETGRQLKDFKALQLDLVQQQRENEVLAEANRKLEAVRAKLERTQQELLREIAALKKSGTAPATGNTAPAIPEIEPVAAIPDPGTVGTPDELVAAGRQAEAEKKTDVAIWNYKTALEIDPENFEAAFRFGKLQLKRQEYAAAEELLQTARRQHPELKGVTILCAEAQIGQQKFGNALALLDPLRQAAPDDYAVLMPSARALAGSGRAAEAIELFRKATELEKSEAAPWLELARVMLHDGSSTEQDAAAAYREARNRGAAPDPELEPELGKMLDEQRELNAFMTAAAAEAEAGGDWDSALWYYRQIAGLDPEDRQIVAHIAFAQLAQGKNAAAEETLTLNQPGTPESFLILALAQWRGRHDAASVQASLDEALRTNGNAPIRLEKEWRLLAAEIEKIRNEPDMKKSPVLELWNRTVVPESEKE